MRAIWLLIVAGVLLGLWMVLGWRRSRRSRLRRAEVQKLLDLAAKDGTLTPAMLQAALGWDKDRADQALSGMRQEGLAHFDVDESGAPVYRVEPKALEARKQRGW